MATEAEIRERLAAAKGGAQVQDGVPIKQIVGQTITVTDYTKIASVKWPGKVFVNFGYIDAGGNEGRAYTAAVAVKRKLEIVQDNMPWDFTVTTYETDKGNPGFDLVDPA